MAQNYDIQMTKFNGTDYDNLYPKTRVSGTSGHLVSLNSSGELQDSGLGFLTNEITLYVNSSTGNDGNDGLSSSKAKKTIMAAINSLPKNLGGYGVTIQIADGTYNESVSVIGFFGSDGSGIQIIGASQNTKITSGYRVLGCSVKVRARNLSISGTISGTVASGIGSLCSEMIGCNIDASGAGNYGIIAEYTNTSLYNVSVSNYQGNYGAIVANGSVIQANSLNGSNNKVGIIAGSDAAGIPGLVIVGINNMTATTKYKRVRGGVILENGATYTYGTTDLTPNVSSLDTGMVHFVYE